MGVLTSILWVNYLCSLNSLFIVIEINNKDCKEDFGKWSNLFPIYYAQFWCLLHSAWKFFTFPSTYFKRENLEETCIISFYFYGYTFLKLEHTVFKTVGKRFLFLWLDSIQLGTYWIFFQNFNSLKRKSKQKVPWSLLDFVQSKEFQLLCNLIMLD